jgi:hypothetical protein
VKPLGNDFPPRNRRQSRSRPAQDAAQRAQLTSTGGDGPALTRAVQRQPVLGEQVWEREMNRLRRIRALLIIALAAVIVRVAIDGAKLIVVLAGALILGLLLCTLALIRQGGRWRRHAESDNERSDAR